MRNYYWFGFFKISKSWQILPLVSHIKKWFPSLSWSQCSSFVVAIFWLSHMLLSGITWDLTWSKMMMLKRARKKSPSGTSLWVYCSTLWHHNKRVRNHWTRKWRLARPEENFSSCVVILLVWFWMFWMFLSVCALFTTVVLLREIGITCPGLHAARSL